MPIETIHANCVTTMLNADELVIEFRRVEVTHIEINKRGGKADYTSEDVIRSPVLARVAVTFSGAIAFSDQLATMIPNCHEFRVRQSAPWLTDETRNSLLKKTEPQPQKDDV